MKFFHYALNRTGNDHSHMMRHRVKEAADERGR